MLIAGEGYFSSWQQGMHISHPKMFFFLIYISKVTTTFPKFPRQHAPINTQAKENTEGTKENEKQLGKYTYPLSNSANSALSSYFLMETSSHPI
jgi:hypothetical protein